MPALFANSFGKKGARAVHPLEYFGQAPTRETPVEQMFAAAQQIHNSATSKT